MSNGKLFINELYKFVLFDLLHDTNLKSKAFEIVCVQRTIAKKITIISV